MKIGLIDVDGHRFPNLALMKISAYHKWIGDLVEWHMGGLFHYDKVYMSKVFSSNYTKDIDEPLNADEVIKGGTGYAIKNENGKEKFDIAAHWELPDEIENISPDYSIYPEYDFAVSLTSRGCPRACGFCHVSKKEGKRTVKTADVSQYWKGQREIIVLDANITACDDRYELLDAYARTGAFINYSQGLDIRLLDDDCIKILNKTKIKGLHFAWDNPREDLEPYFKRVSTKLKKGMHGNSATVYLLTNYNSSLEEDLYRIYTLRDLGYDPYVMIYNKIEAPDQTRKLQRWCNNRFVFKACPDFKDYKSNEYTQERQNGGVK